MEDITVAFWNVQNLFDTTESEIGADLEFTQAEGWTRARLCEKLDALATVINAMFEGAGPEPQASPHFEHQMTPKISRHARCSMSICANFLINGRSRCSGQFGMCS